jgi:hypothetical protein
MSVACVISCLHCTCVAAHRSFGVGGCCFESAWGSTRAALPASACTDALAQSIIRMLGSAA